MNLQEVVEKFKQYPLNMNYGAGKLSRRWKCDRDIVYKAKNIIRYGTEYNPKDVAFNLPKLPKILLFDLETSPTLAYTWGIWQQNINVSAIVSNWILLSWSAKWLFAGNVISDVLTSEEAINEDDERITNSLWKMIEEADIIIAHNGRRFDVKKMNTRFLLHQLPPPSPYQVIDTLGIVKKEFGFTSNKLDSIAGYFNLEPKLTTGFDLWRNCMKGDLESLTSLRRYNEHDVELLEEVYLKIRPWVKSHPNIGLYVESENMVCANCGSDNLKYVGNYHTHVSKYETYRCSCGALNRTRKGIFKNTVAMSVGR